MTIVQEATLPVILKGLFFFLSIEESIEDVEQSSISRKRLRDHLFPILVAIIYNVIVYLIRFHNRLIYNIKQKKYHLPDLVDITLIYLEFIYYGALTPINISR
jgi:hypothetical protein